MNIIDYYPAFHGDPIKRLEHHDYQLADHVFVIGRILRKYLVDDLKIDPKKFTVLGQGVNLDRYREKVAPPDDMKDILGQIAVWVGVMKKSGQELMGSTAAVLAKIGGSMILIGPSGNWEQKAIACFTNIHFMGSKSSEQIPAFLMNSDFGLML